MRDNSGGKILLFSLRNYLKDHMNKLLSKSLVAVAIAAMSLVVPLSVAAQSPTSGGDSIQSGLEDIKGAYPSGRAQGDGVQDLKSLVKTVLEWALYLAGIIAIIFIIIGGYYYITAAGNDTRAASGRKTLVNALIGLVIVVFSYMIVQVVYRFIVT